MEYHHYEKINKNFTKEKPRAAKPFKLRANKFRENPNGRDRGGGRGWRASAFSRTGSGGVSSHLCRHQVVVLT